MVNRDHFNRSQLPLSEHGRIPDWIQDYDCGEWSGMKEQRRELALCCVKMDYFHNLHCELRFDFDQTIRDCGKTNQDWFGGLYFVCQVWI